MKIAVFADQAYVNSLNDQNNGSTMEYIHYSETEQFIINNENIDLIIIEASFIEDGLYIRTKYHGLEMVFVCIRVFLNIKLPIVILSFEDQDSLKSKYFLPNRENTGNYFLQLPIEREKLEHTISAAEIASLERSEYKKFVNQTYYYNYLNHQNIIGIFKQNDILKKQFEDFVEELDLSIIPKVRNIKIDFKSPVFKLLIIDDSNEMLLDLKAKIEEIADTDEVLFEIITTQTSEVALDLIKQDGDIQAVLMDWFLEKVDSSGVGMNMQRPSKNQLINKIKDIRPELPVYVMSNFSQSGNEYVDAPDASGFYFKEDMEYDVKTLFDIVIHRDFKRRKSTPFWTTYKDYIKEAVDTWHPPGHCRGQSFYSSPYLHSFYEYWGREVFTGDLSFGVKEIGFLDESDGSIKLAQERAAKTFRANKTFFVTNGTSCSNHIVMQYVLKPGDSVVIDRNCHKSIHYGILLAGANPIYIDTEYLTSYSFFCPPSLDDILNGLKKDSNIKALILTGSNYEGVILNTKEIIKRVKKKYPKIKIIIDEAWFCYGAFHPKLRTHAACLNEADYVTHSAHKVLSAFSQASMIHVNDDDFNEDFFRDIYQTYLSTSPQYQIIASLDVCSMQMQMEGYKIINELIEISNWFTETIKSWNLKKIKVVDEELLSQNNIIPNWKKEGLLKDPLKVLLDVSEINYSTTELNKILNEEAGLEIERRTKNTILIIFTMGTTRSMIVRLLQSLKKISYRSKTKKATISNLFPKETNILIPPRKAFYFNRIKIELKDLKYIIETKNPDGDGLRYLGNFISSSLVTPYPPGIPLLIFGQRIDLDHIVKLEELNDDSSVLSIHGLKNESISIAGSFIDLSLLEDLKEEGDELFNEVIYESKIESIIIPKKDFIEVLRKIETKDEKTGVEVRLLLTQS